MSTQTVPNAAISEAKLQQNAPETIRPPAFAILILSLIILLGAFLRFYELGAYSIGNSYYAATVQSMLTSWHNFFFASFEPGGSVTVDKPPLGLWVQAESAYLFGVNGFALALPQALAGVLSLPLLYYLVKRHFGNGAGLLAALALAITPVTVSTERNNTMDGLLVFVLLLAAWAFLEAVHKGKVRYLLLGAFLVGLGFNIKMLQAVMPLPAFYGLYLLGAPHRWWKRLLHLAGASALLVVVSLWWPIVVDLTPPENRPYIGSSSNNTVMELIIGHNGIERLASMRLLAAIKDGQAQRPPGADRINPAPKAFVPGNIPGGVAPNQPGQAANGRSQEIGEAGGLRLFSAPLACEAGWLLPLALAGSLIVLAYLGVRWPLSDRRLGLVLWAGWLLPVALYFTFTTGLFHAYYLIMLGPPMAALVGATAWALGQALQRRHWLGWGLTALLSAAGLAAQAGMLKEYPLYSLWILAAALPFWLAGLGLLAWKMRLWLNKVALGLVCLSLMVVPLTWAEMTTLNTKPNVWLPRSGPLQAQTPLPDTSLLSPPQQKIADYLLANTDPEDYLVATLNARQAAPYILTTLRPVLTFGGFTGSDNVVDAMTLAQMVKDGELRFVLGGPELVKQKPDIANWLRQSCKPARVPGIPRSDSPAPGRPVGAGNPSMEALYDCRGGE